ncbi:MAG: hypothetical protein V1921_06510 [Candidatus Altiarchaeota archaeon]
MSGTKVVKLKLDGDGPSQKLPKLKEPPIEDTLKLYDRLEVDADFLYKREYADMLKAAGGVNLMPEQMQEVLSELEKKHGDEKNYPKKAGLFITALIQNSSQERFELDAKKALSYVGCRLKGGKDIKIKGVLGDYTGAEMEDGSITVLGSASDSTGRDMRGGKIHVEGSVNGYTGMQMKAGEITVMGHAGDCTGHLMENGKIKVMQDVGRLTGFNMKGGEIWVGGNAHMDTGSFMGGGKIYVVGGITHIDKDSIKGGEIFAEGSKVWPE